MRLALGLLCGAALLAPGGSGSAAAPSRLAVDAKVLHVGDGRVVPDAVVLVEDGVVTWAGPRAGAPGHAGWPARAAAHVVPGFVITTVMPPLGDEPSIGPDLLGAELFNTFADLSGYIASGVTAIAVSPGRDRLVGGRGALLRIEGAGGGDLHVEQGAVHASLLPEAYEPPLTFRATVPVNVDNPLEPARPQRPHASPAALAELRRALEDGRRGIGPAAFQRVADGSVPLTVHAHRADDIRRAIDLAEEFGVDLVIAGGTEAWKLADELAGAKASVVLTVSLPGRPLPPRREDGTSRPDAAAFLASRGVRVAFAADDWGPTPEPALAAAAAVRDGLPPETALSAITLNAAAAAGVRDVGAIRRGMPADLVGFDQDPLALDARPAFVVAGGRLAFEAAPPRREKVLVVRAGTIHSGATIHREASLTARDGIVTGVGPAASAPAEADVHDFGPRAVIVPGFVDAFSLVGLEPGPGPSGSARLRAAAAIELDDDSLRRAAAAGVTSALVVPPARGPVLGMAALASTVPRLDPPPRDADLPELSAEEEAAASRPTLDILSGDAGLVFFVDGGVGDVGARGPRVKALKEILGRAKGYHERFEKKDAKKDGKADSKKGGKAKAAATSPRGPDRRRGAAAPKGGKADKTDKPEKDPALEPFRPLFAGKAKAFLVAGRQDGIMEGLDAFKDVGITPILVGAEEGDLVRDELARRKVSVILGTDVLRQEEGRVVNVAAELREASVPIAFGSMEFGAAETLPLAVARAVRHGLSADDGLVALTLAAGDILGPPESLGRLARGDRADFVVFSGDPMEPTSRVLAVSVRGELQDLGTPGGVGQ